MLLLNLTDENLTEKISVELSNLDNLKNLFLKQKNILLKYFNTGIIDIYKNNNIIIELNKFLEDFNSTFDKINDSLNRLKILQDKLEFIINIINNKSTDLLSTNLNSYNTLYTSNYPSLLDSVSCITDFIEGLFIKFHYENNEIARTILSNNYNNSSSSEIEEIVVSNDDSVVENNEFKINEQKISENTVNTEALNSSEEVSKKVAPIYEDPYKNLTRKKLTKLPLQDNDTLMISEVDGFVYLPFKVENLKLEFIEKSKKYSGLIDLINNEYIYPISKYKNSVASRFKEAYSLVINKEKGSPLSALELAIEVSFNYSLHPAIITACKSLEELDSYLEALKNNNLSEFKYFNIIFDTLPK